MATMITKPLSNVRSGGTSWSSSYQVEIFSDELRAICPGCGREVYKEKTPSCIDWCRAAEQCLGEEAYTELTRRKGNERVFGEE